MIFVADNHGTLTGQLGQLAWRRVEGLYKEICEIAVWLHPYLHTRKP